MLSLASTVCQASLHESCQSLRRHQGPDETALTAWVMLHGNQSRSAQSAGTLQHVELQATLSTKRALSANCRLLLGTLSSLGTQPRNARLTREQRAATLRLYESSRESVSCRERSAIAELRGRPAATPCDAWWHPTRALGRRWVAACSRGGRRPPPARVPSWRR